jgi:hypothetical protein
MSVAKSWSHFRGRVGRGCRSRIERTFFVMTKLEPEKKVNYQEQLPFGHGVGLLPIAPVDAMANARPIYLRHKIVSKTALENHYVATKRRNCNQAGMVSYTATYLSSCITAIWKESSQHLNATMRVVSQTCVVGESWAVSREGWAGLFNPICREIGIRMSTGEQNDGRHPKSKRDFRGRKAWKCSCQARSLLSREILEASVFDERQYVGQLRCDNRR